VLPVTGKDRDVVARLVVVSRSLEAVGQNIGEVLRWAVERHDAGGLHGSELRSVGHRLVSLAGDVTTLGVDLARWADECDDMTDTAGEDDSAGL
jgi:hypothetical protein